MRQKRHKIVENGDEANKAVETNGTNRIVIFSVPSFSDWTVETTGTDGNDRIDKTSETVETEKKNSRDKKDG